MKLVTSARIADTEMPIQAADPVRNVLFDFASHCWRNIRRRKNTLDDLGRRTGSFVAVEEADIILAFDVRFQADQVVPSLMYVNVPPAI